MNNVFMKSFFKACYDIAGLYFWLTLFISIAYFANSILILIILFRIFNYTQLNMTFTIEILLSLMVNRFFLGYFKLLTENKIRRLYCNHLNSYFTTSNWLSDSSSLISTLISRDIPLLLETIPTIPKLLYFPICFIIGIATIYKFIGMSGVFAILTVILFTPISIFIARKSFEFANQIFDLSKSRLGEISKWIEWRSIINSWAESDIILERINKIAEKELHARTQDSFWRSLDLYIITFGRCIPVAILIVISMLYKNDISNQLLLTLWLSVPFIGLIMEAGRFITDFQLGKKAFFELQKSSKPLPKHNESDLVLDDTWEIWDGTLAENCLVNESNSHLSLLNKLRLDHELGTTNQEQYLSRFGQNISEGQKTRILLVRAIHIALNNNTTVRIERTLNSLDPDVCHRLVKILSQPIIIDKIKLSKSCKEFLEHQILRNRSPQEAGTDSFIHHNKNEKPQSINQKSQLKNLLIDFFAFFNPLSFIFLIPAMSLSFVGYIAIANITLSTKLFTILFVSIVSVMLVVYLGVSNETHTRQWAKIKMFDILKNARLSNSTDIYQRLSRDFTTVVERISWYLHDITWLLSLVLVSVIATIISFGMMGILIDSIFLLFGFGVWRIFEEKINNVRAALVYAINHMLIMGENLICFGNLSEYPYIDKIRKNMIQTSVDNLYEKNSQLVSIKTKFSNLIMCVSGFFILATLICSTYSWIASESLVFILTAILAVDSSLSILFQALSGFSAQRISIHRLSDFDRQSNNSAHGMIAETQGG